MVPDRTGDSGVADVARVLLGLANSEFEVERGSGGVFFQLTEQMSSADQLAIWEAVCARVSGLTVVGSARVNLYAGDPFSEL